MTRRPRAQVLAGTRTADAAPTRGAAHAQRTINGRAAPAHHGTAHPRSGTARRRTAAGLVALVALMATVVAAGTTTAGAAAVTSSAPPDGLFGQAYSHTFSTDLTDAVWSVTSGALPSSIGLAPATG